ncbi:hypothetical protein ALQ65_200283 [Pseudomonas syringae pv. coriandricola]|uniref:Uncharacterized protein n=1 Tax=Pseudomonas syringae pv. coriandricola TaxID=264453 RepID=A0A3M3JDH0_9PSED|nr:hypothetical protein ALQ65_200283 [Pseudomonas syringae pv. coriandricola]
MVLVARSSRIWYRENCIAPVPDLSITSIMRGGTISVVQVPVPASVLVPNHLLYRAVMVPLTRSGASPG